MSKVLHLIGRFEEDSGGAQRVILDIINSIEDSDLKMGVCSLFGNASLSGELTGEVYQKHFSSSFKINPKIFYDLYQLLRNWQPDILHVHSPVVGIYGRPLARLLGIKLISTVHNDVREISLRNKLIDKCTIKFSDGIVCVSNAVEESVMEVYSPIPSSVDFATIANCIDCVKFKAKIRADEASKRAELNIKNDDFIFGTVGSLHPQKGHKYLLEAWTEVVKKNPSSKLLIIGEGGEKNKLKGISETLGVSESVFFLGSRNDVPDLLNLLDVFVFPSLYEGLPIALLEAMCMGKVIIASDIPHISMVLEDAGIYVPPTDSKELAKAMIQTLKSPDIQNSFGKKASQLIDQKFVPYEFGKKYHGLYQKLL